jgi:hypothetical protein
MTLNIIEGNEKIALFDGMKLTTNKDWKRSYYCEYDNDGSIKKEHHQTKDGIFRTLRYHESWEVLMPVVEKIEEMGYFTNAVLMRSEKPAKHFFSITDRSHVCLADAYSDKKIDAWYAAVLKFIDWYNQKSNG